MALASLINCCRDNDQNLLGALDLRSGLNINQSLWVEVLCLAARRELKTLLVVGFDGAILPEIGSSFTILPTLAMRSALSNGLRMKLLIRNLANLIT